MKIAVISDIHGNMEALQAVVSDLQQAGADEIFCLGDCIGYGPDSELVANEIMKLNIPTVTGNHELVLHSPVHIKWFNSLARISLEKTLPTLSNPVKNFLRSLPPSMAAHGARFVHGCPLQSVKTYLFLAPDDRLKRAIGKMPEKICFVGHTHDLALVTFNGKRIERNQLLQAETFFDDRYSYIVNVGSVGQPRDGTNTAKYVLWDTGAQKITLRCREYDIAKTVAKIKSAGLPEAHGRRLWQAM